METTKEKTIGQMVAEDYRTASVFKKHNIDFCCNGNRSLENVCETENLNMESLLQDLENTQTTTATTADFKNWPLDLLADYVEKKHHRYVTEKTGEIKPYLEKICQVHGDRHPELFKIKELFDTSAGELARHMKKEELVLFPLIRKLETATVSGTKPERSVAEPINKMMAEHDDEGERFREIAKLSDNYTPPVDACNTYKVTFGLLQEFENDLHLHIHLENNILFPKSIALEEKLTT